MAVATDLPRWNLTVYFPGLDSPEFEQALSEIKDGLAKMEADFDSRRIEKGNRAEDPAGVADALIPAFNALVDKAQLVEAYIYGFVTADSRNSLAQARDSEFEFQLVRLRKLTNRLTGWLGSQDVDELLTRSEQASAHEYAVTKAVIAAKHMMSPAEEALASELEATGRSAWSKLHSNMTSQILVELDGDRIPMSAVRALAHDPDRETRRRAYEAELAAWKTVDVPIAAAMNSIKGEALLVSNRRGWNEPLDEALFAANIDRETLDAMMTAARESFPDFRRYLNAKARALGLEKLAYYDLFAPLQGSESTWPYEQATGFVVQQFGSYSKRMADLAVRSFGEDWIDVPPAEGKVGGAYCMGTRGGESRVLMNYEPSFSSVSTLAHELGHAYHNLCLAERTGLQRSTPMTLAETASIFCETIIREAVLNSGEGDEQLLVLEASLQGACQVVVDITSRFLFEKGVYDRRGSRELSPGEMCDLMLDAQRQTYGDGLDTDLLHPYMWAAKPHYYSSASFYNFPYMFGLLFGLGLYSVYRREPAGFQERYDELLSSTGLADAATLGQGFGIDIRSVDFWRGSLDQIRADIERFERLI
jgi:oligoendopeptidase F